MLFYALGLEVLYEQEKGDYSLLVGQQLHVWMGTLWLSILLMVKEALNTVILSPKTPRKLA